MATRYCVFWIPNTHHNDFNLLPNCTNTAKANICDNVGKSHEIFVEIIIGDKANRDIMISSIPEKDIKKKKKLHLRYVQSSHNGLIEFSFEIDRRNPELKFIENALPTAIYHLFKNFFHTHEFHSDESDSILNAFIDDERVDLQTPDNKALIFYLQQFEEKFIAYKEYINELIQVVEQENPWEFDDNDNIVRIELSSEEKIEWLLHNINTRYPLIEDMCNNAIGETIYYNSLLHSWYNQSCKLSVMMDLTNGSPCGNCKKNESIDIDLCKKLHRTALNTKNALDNIKLLHHKNRDLLKYFSSKISLESLQKIKLLISKTQNSLDRSDIIASKSWKVAKASIAIAVVSLVITAISFWIAFQDKESKVIQNQLNETNTKTSLIKTDIKELKESIKQIQEQIAKRDTIYLPFSNTKNKTKNNLNSSKGL